MELRAYQKLALEFCLEKKSAYLALDMGMGKTAIALNWVSQINVKGTLVVAPLRTIYSSWPEEKEKWAPALSSALLHGPNKTAELRKTVDLYFINYEGLAWLLNEVKRIYKQTKVIPFRSIILDEGSMVKSASTKRFKILKVLGEVATQYKLIMSGTPAPNSLLDLWPQYYFLDRGTRLGPTITSYRSKYFTQLDIGKNKVSIFTYFLKPGMDTVIHEMISDITYRLDSADYLDLPPQIINEIKVPMPKKLMDQYKELEEDFFIQLESSEIEAMSAPSLAMKLRQFVQGGLYTDEAKIAGERPWALVHKEKLKVLEGLVEEANGQGILCAIQFRFELEMIHEKFPDAPVIAGGVSAAEAGRLIKLWNKGEIPLLLCHPASLSHGVNLQTGAHLIVWYGLTWSLEQYLQFNARLHRSGQINTVVIHHLIAAGTIDEKIMRALTNKFKGQRALLDYLKGVR